VVVLPKMRIRKALVLSSDMLPITYSAGKIESMVKNLIISLLKRLWFVSRLAFWSALWIFGLSVFLLYPIRWFSGDYFSLVRIINYFMPWLLVLLVPAMLIAGLAKRKWLLATLAGPTLALCFTFAPLFWPNHNPSPPDGSFSFKMMSHNLFHRQNVGAILGVIRVETPAGPMAIWNVHLIPPFRGLPQWHDQQVAALVADIAGTDGPLIMAGDFNATDQSATYRAINRYLNNAHREAGWGFGFTFPAPPYTKGLPFYPGLLYRIDHIFYSDHFVAYDARTLAISAGSDHLPIMADLWLK
jgi:hypothetical protein